MNSNKLEQEIEKCLRNFYEHRLSGLKDLSLKKVLKKKNPYLYRAMGMENASDIVEQLMAAFITSSDETIFGNVFFEPLARVVAKGNASPSEGIDFIVETSEKYLAVAVKSGPNWGNADQHKRQSTNFESLKRRLYKMNKQFDPLVGQAYGQQSSEPTENSRFRRRSGQAFWEEITGDNEFYLKIIRCMRDVPQRFRPKWKSQWDQAVNRFSREFMDDFCFDDGSIDWEKLVAFNSSNKR
jgi:hypothetical protein